MSKKENWNVGWGTGLTGGNAAFTLCINDKEAGKYTPIRCGKKLIAIIPHNESGYKTRSRLIAAAPKTKRDRDALLKELKNMVSKFEKAKSNYGFFRHEDINCAKEAIAQTESEE